MPGQATAAAQGGGDPVSRAVPAPPGSPRRDLALLAVLVVAALALRAWHLAHTDVAARDSIGFIRYAWQLGHQSWVRTIRDPRQQQHPGYPFAILAISYPVRALAPGSEPRVMQLSAQLTSCLAGVLLVVPGYYLGRELFGRGVGFWAALLFQCLPAGGRVFADGLSEALFLLLAATALFAAVRAFRAHAPGWFALAGTFGALAYLTRPEGALIVAATALVLFAPQCSRARGAPRRRLLACAAALGGTAVLVGCPLFLITGKLTAKPTPIKLINGALGSEAAEPLPVPGGDARLTLPLAVWVTGPLDPGSSWGLKAVGREFAKGSHYVMWVPTLLGLVWFRERFRRLPGDWVLLLVSLAILALMWRVASRFGYVSDRHLLLPLLCAGYPAVAVLPRLTGAFAAVARRLPGLRWIGARLPAAAHPVWTALLVGGLIGAALPKTLLPLHVDHAPFRSAGEWIAGHSHEWDDVVDPYTWSGYYAGRMFHDGRAPAPPTGERRMAYLVVEESAHHAQLTAEQVARDRARDGRKVWEWKGRGRTKDDFEVAVYEVPE